MVVQVARNLGCKVVGIAGSDAKCNFLVNELGCVGAINYKGKDTQGMIDALKKECPNGIDIYYDNVGGIITDAVISLINVRARILICGSISQYNDGLEEANMGPRFFHRVLYTRCTIQGILARDYYPKHQEMVDVMAKWIQEGKLKYKESFVEGFEKLPEALNSLFHGTHTGKVIVKK